MKTFIIAEIGVNHDGHAHRARTLIEYAIIAGADAVKFQVFNLFPDIEKYKLTIDEYVKLFEYVESFGLKWFATGFDQMALNFLKSRGQTLWKVPSGFIGNAHYYRMVKDLMGDGDTVFVSTGMSTMVEIHDAVYAFGMHDVVLMQCTSQYPTPPKDVNLAVLNKYKTMCARVGLSYHGHDTVIPAAAVAMGAEVVEVHITTDRELEGPDHKASMDVVEFKTMVDAIRTVELAMGLEDVTITAREKRFRTPIRKRMKEAIE